MIDIPESRKYLRTFINSNLPDYRMWSREISGRGYFLGEYSSDCKDSIRNIVGWMDDEIGNARIPEDFVNHEELTSTVSSILNIMNSEALEKVVLTKEFAEKYSAVKETIDYRDRFKRVLNEFLKRAENELKTNDGKDTSTPISNVINIQNINEQSASASSSSVAGASAEITTNETEKKPNRWQKGAVFISGGILLIAFLTWMGIKGGTSGDDSKKNNSNSIENMVDDSTKVDSTNLKQNFTEKLDSTNEETQLKDSLPNNSMKHTKMVNVQKAKVFESASFVDQETGLVFAVTHLYDKAVSINLTLPGKPSTQIPQVYPGTKWSFFFEGTEYNLVMKSIIESSDLGNMDTDGKSYVSIELNKKVEVE